MALVHEAVIRCILTGKAMKKTRGFLIWSSPFGASTKAMPARSNLESP